MATPLPLEGDGLVENLFHYLWTTDDLDGGPRVSVPPTVIYRGSQPVAWYFTSRKSGRIKRKHRANLTAAHIEHSFTKRRIATDIVAYYLYLPKSMSTCPAIEYYDAEALREFLFRRPEIPHSSSPGSVQTTGILQQFPLPKGARNSTLRAIWSPKLCLLERRVNVHAIHDARFSVYERGVTFEEGGGAEALSRPEPVRGSMLPGMVQQVCERIVDHVTRVSYHKFRIARMVIRLQVDADDRLWLLWSSSLRLQPPLGVLSTSEMLTNETAIRPLDIVSDAKVPTFAFAQGSGAGPVSLSSTSNPEVDEEPRPGQIRCASCAKVVAHRALLPTTYKAVLAHFQHVLKFLRERVTQASQVAFEWPPDDRVVQQAGGVGFGILRHFKSVSSSDDNGGPKAGSGSGQKGWQGRDLLIPPVIRYLHPTLSAEDFARHRQDPIFLHKTVGVCERCCLVYADYATASLEANGLGIRSSASAPALLRPTREMPRHAKYFDDDQSDTLLLTINSKSSLVHETRSTTSKTKPPASAWKPFLTDDHRQGRFSKYKTGARSTLASLPMAPKLPPRIESFESEDNDALRIPDSILHDDGTSQQEQQQREETFFRDLYQQKDTAKREGHALRHILEAADRLSKAKPQHRLAALGNNTRIGQCQSTGALMGAITELKLAKKPGKSPYSLVQRIRDAEENFSRNQAVSPSSPAKSPHKHRSKRVKKKKASKRTKRQAGGGVERERFVSSREKKAAAAHRGYLVAALSDAQVQLEHIESLTTLVLSVEAEPEQSERRRHHKKKKEEEKSALSPQKQSIFQEEANEKEQEEREEVTFDKQELQERTDKLQQDADVDEQEIKEIASEQQEELGDYERHNTQVSQQETQAQESDFEEEENAIQTEMCDDRLEIGEDSSRAELLQTEDEFDGQQQENLDGGEIGAPEHRSPELVVLEDNGAAQLCDSGRNSQDDEIFTELQQDEHEVMSETDDRKEQDEDPLLQRQSDFCHTPEQENDQHENPMLDQHDEALAEPIQCQDDEVLEGPICDDEDEQELDQAEEPMKAFEERIQGQYDEAQEDEAEDEYEDEYEEPDHDDQENMRQQVEVFERDDTFALLTPQGECTPAADILEQAQELLAIAAPSESLEARDEHEADQFGFNETSDTNDQYIAVSPVLQALEEDSSENAVFAADSALAAALAFSSSDRPSNSANDEY